MAVNSSNAETFHRLISWFYYSFLGIFIVPFRHILFLGNPGNFGEPFIFKKSSFCVFCQHTMQFSKISMWLKSSDLGVSVSHPSRIIRLFLKKWVIFPNLIFSAHNRILRQSLYNKAAIKGFQPLDLKVPQTNPKLLRPPTLSDDCSKLKSNPWCSIRNVN